MSGAELHCHTLQGSNESDSAEIVVKDAIDADLEALAITDHDTVFGIDYAIKAAEGKIRIIPGVELDCIWYDKNIGKESAKGCHVLYLFCPYDDPKFRDELYKLFAKPRNDRVFKMVDNLVKKKELSLRDANALKSSLNRLVDKKGSSGDRTILTTDMLAFQCSLLFALDGDSENKITEDIRRNKSNKSSSSGRLMSKYFSYMSPIESSCYVPYKDTNHVSLEEAFEFTKKYGGVAGLAHVYRDFKLDADAMRVFDESVECGAVFTGVRHPAHSDEKTDKIRKMINDSEKPVIGIDASDYHGRRHAASGSHGGLARANIGEYRTSMEIVAKLEQLSLR